LTQRPKVLSGNESFRRTGLGGGERFMNLYPIFLRLHKKRCLVVGGGMVAERKVKSLINAGAEVTVIAPRLTEELSRTLGQGCITHIERNYRENDMEGFYLVIASTDSQRTNRNIYLEGEKRGVPVNVVDDPQNSSFFVPSLIRRGNLQIALSTSGTAPIFAKELRKYFEKKFYPELERDLGDLARLRKDIIQNAGNRGDKGDRRLGEILLPRIEEILGKIEAHHD
jgi:siroheme synthase-like protein